MTYIKVSCNRLDIRGPIQPASRINILVPDVVDINTHSFTVFVSANQCICKSNLLLGTIHLLSFLAFHNFHHEALAFVIFDGIRVLGFFQGRRTGVGFYFSCFPSLRQPSVGMHNIVTAVRTSEFASIKPCLTA